MALQTCVSTELDDPIIIPHPGDILLTTFGIAVCIQATHTYSSIFKARIWRVPGKSVGSSATAFLRYDSIIKRLPVAPGMTTKYVATTSNDTESSCQVLVQSYSPTSDSFLVSALDNDSPLIGSSEKRRKDSMISSDPFSIERSLSLNSSRSISSDKSYGESSSLISVKPKHLMPSKSAKFYPVIDTLMQKGNEAAALAGSTLTKNPELVTILSKSFNFITAPSDSEEGKDCWKSNGVETQALNLVPNAKDAEEIYKMLRDEELTVLLEKGQERLRQLVAKDLPEATAFALKKLGVEVLPGDTSSSIINRNQEKALNDLDQLLIVKGSGCSIEDLGRSLGDQFSSTLESFAVAARSDTKLNSLFDNINQKTSEWQKRTGRLLESRSAAVVFEGSQWLQSRFENIFSNNKLPWAKNTDDRLTKAFTEGDIALARLKSLELGESIRSRLITAIEMRSDSQGGLDGIIAGAIANFHSSNGIGGLDDNLQTMISRLQDTASSAKKQARESLLSVLSHRSQYQDAAVLRIEQVLMDLDSYIGDLSAEQIALMADGGDGTAAIFEPIAKKAAEEIQKQLDVAESSIQDPTLLSILKQVRRIVSGDLSMDSLFDELGTILNDEKVASVGENLMVEGERILDAIEGVSDSQTVNKVIAAVEKAGITKDTILQKLEGLNMSSLLETAETAVTDEKKRMEMISSLMDSALDFFLRILPSMPIPAFDGVKDGLLYSIANLSMHGFRVKKEDITLEIAGIRAGDSSDERPSVTRQGSVGEISKRVLVIDIQNIAAVFEKAQWAFEQTYLPYLKGKGLANVTMSKGCIRLVFELRRRKVTTRTKSSPWEPILCLHHRECSIDQVDLVFEGDSRLTWIINKLASMFKTSLRDYVVKTVLEILAEKSGWLLENLNRVLSKYWDIVLQVAKLELIDLLEADEADIIAASPDPNADEIDLVWREHLPLGINLMINNSGASNRILVAEFPRGSQARKVAVDKKLDPDIFQNAIIIGVNGTRYTDDEAEDMFVALKDPARPKTIKFRLVKPNLDVDEGQNQIGSIGSGGEQIEINTIDILNEGTIGISFMRSIDIRFLVIRNMSEMSPSIKRGQVESGDLLTHLNGKYVGGAGGIDYVLSFLESEGSKRPLYLSFMKPYLESLQFSKPPTDVGISDRGGPIEFILESLINDAGRRRVYIKGFRCIDGIAETSGVLLGDHLVFVDATPVGKGCQLIGDSNSISLERLNKMLRTLCYPVALMFARPSRETQSPSSRLNIDAAYTFSVQFSSYEQIGCEFGLGATTDDFVVKSFHAVEGLFQQQLKSNKNSLLLKQPMSIESVNGQPLPIYANSELVLNAMNRIWRTDGKLELVLCDENRKRQVGEKSSDFTPLSIA